MAHSSDTKANTVHSRAKRSCLNCEKYFIPKNSLPKYVEGRTTQTWCSRACYVVLYPQVVEEIQCPYCSTISILKRKDQATCGSEECKKELNKEYNRKWRKVPKNREKARESNRKWLEDPENREKDIERSRKRREDPEYREKENKKALERYHKNMEDPENREKKNKNRREWYHRNKEKSDGSQ